MNARRDSIANILTKVFLYPFSFAVSVITSRILGPADKGMLGYGMTVVSLCMTVLTFGVGLGMFYHIGNKRYKVSEVFWSVLFFSFFLGICISGFICSIYALGMIPIFSRFSTNQILLLCLIVVFGLCQSFLNRLLLADGHFIVDNKIRLSLGIAQPLVLLLLVWNFNMGLQGVLTTSFIIAFVGALVMFLVINKLYGTLPFSMHMNFLRDSWEYGIKSWLGDVTQMANLRLDQLILGFFVPVYQLGIYTVAVAMMEILWFVPDAINSVLLNKMTSPLLTTNEKMVLAGRICKSLLLFTTLFAVFLYFVVKYVLLPYGYGSAFITAISPFVWLLPGAIFLIYAKVVTKILTGTGFVGDTSKAIVIGSIANTTLYFILIPSWGILGAAIATTGGYLCISLATLYILKRRYSTYFETFMYWTKNDLEWVFNHISVIFKNIKIYKLS